MRPGPAPKPVELKIVEGNPGKRPLPEVPQPAISDEIPDPPEILGEEGRKVWKRIAPELHRLGLLTDLDLEELASVCLAWQTAHEAAEDLKKNGLIELSPVYRKDGEQSGTRRQRNPAAQALRDNLATFRAFAAEFGLSPSSRTRFNVPTEEVDELEKLLD